VVLASERRSISLLPFGLCFAGEHQTALAGRIEPAAADSQASFRPLARRTILRWA